MWIPHSNADISNYITIHQYAYSTALLNYIPQPFHIYQLKCDCFLTICQLKPV